MRTLNILVAVTAIAVVSCSGKHQRDAARVPDIEVARATTDSVTLYKTFPGTLIANASVDVVARVNGTITAKHYNSGDMVRRGQALFSIESSTYRDAVAEAEAALATARSQHDYATRQRAAMEKALKSDAVSEMEVEQARSSEREAAASIKSAEAALSRARTNLGYCTVTSPIDGRVSDNLLSVGNYVGGEGAPVKLCTVYDNSYVLATFAIEDVSMAENVKEALAGKGYDMPLHFGEQLRHDYRGTLHYLAPNMNNSTGTMAMQALIENPYDELRPGMYVDVSLPVGTDPHAVLVRDASLSTDQLGKFLYTVNDSDRVVYTPVKVGDMVDDSMRVVSSGLRAGERYVVSAMLKVRDGMEVNPVEQNK